MLAYKTIASLRLLALLQLALAQRPSTLSICDYYSETIFGNTSPDNELKLMTYIVNTIFAGNVTKPNIQGISWPDLQVPGILTPGTKLGQAVNLLPYFNGGLASSNRNGQAVALNSLDDGGISALMRGVPANGDNSLQFSMMTHFYEFFGLLLGCSQQGQHQTLGTYQGEPSQYKVHAFMALDTAQVHYFTDQVFLSLRSFGFTVDDSQAVSDNIVNVFGERCAPAATVVPGAGSLPQAICIASDCMPASNSDCSGYGAVVAPAVADSSLATAVATALGTAPATSSASATGTIGNTLSPASATKSPTGSSPINASSSPSSSSSSSSTSSSSSSGQSSGSSPSTGSDGTKIGIGVGVGVGAIILLVLAGTIYCHRRRAREKSGSLLQQEKADAGKLQDPGVAVDYHSQPGVAVDDGR